MLEPGTIDGLVYASSMVILHAARHLLPVPRLDRWMLALGIAASLAVNVAQPRGPLFPQCVRPLRRLRPETVPAGRPHEPSCVPGAAALTRRYRGSTVSRRLTNQAVESVTEKASATAFFY